MVSHKFAQACYSADVRTINRRCWRPDSMISSSRLSSRFLGGKMWFSISLQSFIWSFLSVHLSRLTNSTIKSDLPRKQEIIRILSWTLRRSIKSSTNKTFWEISRFDHQEDRRGFFAEHIKDHEDLHWPAGPPRTPIQLWSDGYPVFEYNRHAVDMLSDLSLSQEIPNCKPATKLIQLWFSFPPWFCSSTFPHFWMEEISRSFQNADSNRNLFILRLMNH